MKQIFTTLMLITTGCFLLQHSAAAKESRVGSATLMSITCPTDFIGDVPGDTAVAIAGMATASDPSQSISYIDVVIPGSCDGRFTLERTWIAEDPGGNLQTCVQIIQINDYIPPTITCPADVAQDCPGDTTVATTGMATGADACSAVTIAYMDSVEAVCPGTFTVYRMWTAADGSGNMASCTQTIEVQDLTAPVISCPADVVQDCPGDTTVAMTGMATAVESCSEAIITYRDSAEITGVGGLMVYRLWTATDSCGNSSSCTQMITVQDTTPPMITCPADVAQDCPGDTTVATTGMATGTDACGAVSIAYMDSVEAVCPGTFTVYRMWTAADGSGNMASCTQTIEVQDLTAPVITCPADVVQDCPGDTTVAMTGMATAVESCSEAMITYRDSAEIPGVGGLMVYRLWTATDSCGNSSTCTQMITVQDTTPPMITCPGDVAQDCPGDTTVATTGMATGTDACSSVSIAYMDSVDAVCPGTFTVYRMWTAADGSGNMASCTQMIEVVDTTRPVFTSSVDTVMFSCGEDLPSLPSFTVSDVCGLFSLDTTEVANSAIICAGFVQTTTITAVDSCGNADSIQFVFVFDEDAPMLMVDTVQCESQNTYSVSFTAVADSIEVSAGTLDTLNGVVTAVPLGTDLTFFLSNGAGCRDTVDVISPVDCPIDSFRLVIKVLLEGPYDALSGQMTTNINEFRLLPGQDPQLSADFFSQLTNNATPIGQPYNTAPWNHTGTEGDRYGDSTTNPSANLILYPDTIVDWVLVSLRENSPIVTSVVWTCAGLLGQDGFVTFPEECDPLPVDTASTYRVVIEHRNHLSTMSDEIRFTSSMQFYDFTANEGYATGLGSPQEVSQLFTDGRYMMYGGNSDQSLFLGSSRREINALDFTTTVAPNFSNIRTYLPADHNLDGDVNTADRTQYVEFHFGLFSSVF